jgi:hypothetical protein
MELLECENSLIVKRREKTRVCDHRLLEKKLSMLIFVFDIFQQIHYNESVEKVYVNYSASAFDR